METGFTRQRSGYIREFNALDVLVLNVLGYSIGLAVCTTPPFVGGLAPTAPLWAVIIFGALLALCNGLAYGLFAGLMPNTGGDYHFVGRTLNHFLGFSANWGFTLANTFGLAFNLIAFFNAGLAPALLTLDPNRANLAKLGQSITSPLISLACGTLLLGCLVIVALSGRSLHRLFLYPFLAGAILGSAIMCYVIWTTPHEAFVAALNRYVADATGRANGYQSILAAAAQRGVPIGAANSLRAALGALPLGFLCFVGFNYSVYLGGEVRRPLRSQSLGIMAGLLVGVVAFLFLFGGYSRLVGRDFIAALGAGGTVLADHGIPSTSTSFFVGLVLPSGSLLNFAMQVLNLLWFFSVPLIIIQVCVRNVIAWSCDEMFFSSMRKRTRKTYAPWAAVLLVAAGAEIWMVANVLTGASLVGAAALLAVPSMLTGLAALLLPWRRVRFWNATSGNGPIKLMILPGFSLFQLAGLLCTVGSGWMIWETIKLDSTGNVGAQKVLAYLAAVYGLGILVYIIFWRRFVLRIPGGRVEARKFLQELPSD